VLINNVFKKEKSFIANDCHATANFFSVESFWRNFVLGILKTTGSNVV